MPRSRLFAPIVLMLLFPALSFSSSIYLGLVSFDVLIPAGAGPGVNVFSISNFTGDPGSGGFALPPDFPAFTNLTFMNASLTVNDGILPVVFSLGDLGPGSLSPAILQFPDTSLFISATFSATLSQTSIVLANATIFNAGSPTITVQILPSSGPTLQAGTDFGLISISEAAASVPEPGTSLLTIASVFALAMARSRRKRGSVGYAA